MAGSQGGRTPAPRTRAPGTGSAPDGFEIAGCIRLPVRADAARIAAELERLPEEAWTTGDRDVFVHVDVHSLRVLGERDGPRVVHTDDLPILESLPSLRVLVREVLPGRPRRVLVARLRAGGIIPRHTDTGPFLEGTIRLSICIVSEPSVRFHCNGRWYAMRSGEVWVLGNRAPHGAVHAGSGPRIHVIADLEPNEALLALVERGERDLGVVDPFATRRLVLQTRLRGVRKDLGLLGQRLLERWRA